MNLLRLNNVLALSVAGVLALSGCGGGDGGNDDGGVKDGGADTGPPPDVVPDAGPLDTGPVDAGREDTGPRDTGPGLCDNDLLGCPCVPDDMMPQGSCLAAEHVCIQWSDPGAPVVATCVRPCTAEMNGDMECMGELVAGKMNRPASLCRSGTCREEEVMDGDDCVAAAPGGERLSGCRPASLCIFGLSDSQYTGSCGRRCATGADCAAPNPICNPLVLNSTVTPGICSDKLRGLGSMCRSSDITGICDTRAQFSDGGSKLFCFEIFTPEGTGQCFEVCDVRNPVNERCIASVDATRDPVCKTGLFQSPDFGLCSDECSVFPENCAAPGSEALGQNCTGDIGFQGLEGVDFSWCLDVVPPVIREWDFEPANLVDCGANEGDQFRCEHGSFCLPLGGGTPLSGCIRGCNALAGTTTTGPQLSGCQLTTVSATTCESLEIMMIPEGGICVPPAP